MENSHGLSWTPTNSDVIAEEQVPMRTKNDLPVG